MANERIGELATQMCPICLDPLVDKSKLPEGLVTLLTCCSKGVHSQCLSEMIPKKVARVACPCCRTLFMRPSAVTVVKRPYMYLKHTILGDDQKWYNVSYDPEQSHPDVVRYMTIGINSEIERVRVQNEDERDFWAARIRINGGERLPRPNGSSSGQPTGVIDLSSSQ